MLKLSYFSLLFIILYGWGTPSFALKKSYIVYMGEHSGGIQQLTKDLLHNRTDSQIDFLGSFLGCKKKAKKAMFYSYRRYINGFAAYLDEEEVEAIKKNPKVVSVFRNEARQLHTTRSWEFLSLERNGMVPKESLWRRANFGEDIIIGNIDSGVWPESQSFNDEGYGPIPSKWKGRCEDDNGSPFPCNRKLIGAKYFYDGYVKNESNTKLLIDSARDYDGHGTHTLSTAGGNFVKGASVLGLYNGTAKGGSPKARVAAYKVCWPLPGAKATCYDADILKAFDHAINDGVNVISVSLGGDVGEKYFDSAIAIGSFNAIKHGITVVASAGNDGPDDGTVDNVAPWIIIVAASTMDRAIYSYVQLQNGARLKGTTMSKPIPQEKFYPLIGGTYAKAHNSSAQDALLCKKEALDPKKVKGKILICLRGEFSKHEKGENAASAGAVGMILCNDKKNGNDLSSDALVLPTVQLTYTDGLIVLAYLNKTRNSMVLITSPKAEVNVKPAPVIASFSSRGPNKLTPEILKPDITAPGVNVVAAYTEGKGVDPPLDERKTKYSFMSGTSMSCPHVAGVVALLKKNHPKWSPAAIRSALMTTASRMDNTDKPILNQPNYAEATPFAYGAGHIRPNHAADPGLVYDMQPRHYTRFLCSIGYNQTVMRNFTQSYTICNTVKKMRLLDFNYPSITVPKLSRSVTVSRKLTNVGSRGTYIAKIHEPRGVSVSIQPNTLKFSKTGKTKKFRLTFTRNATVGKIGYVFGELVWSDGRHNVRSPIAVGPS